MRQRYLALCFKLASALALCGEQPVQAAPTPSFLCSQASTWVEKAICASEPLANLDMELATVYARLLRADTSSSRQSLSKEQGQWWAGRSNCQRATDPIECLSKAYALRITTLKSRADYPGDTLARAPRIVQEASIRAADVGWARRLSEYARAIRSCSAQSPRPVTAVLSAWMEPRDELVGMWLQGPEEQVFLCLATRDGKRLDRIRPRSDDEQLPERAPMLHLTSAAGKCPNAVPVTDAEGRPFGWLTPGACPSE